MFKSPFRFYFIQFVVKGLAKYNSKMKTIEPITLNLFNVPGRSLLKKIILSALILFLTSFNPPGKKAIRGKPNSVRVNSAYSITKVVIDAGHGGHDGGCVGSKTKEKDVALAIALKLGHYIEDHFHDVKVVYTRKSDVFVELYQRAAIANNAKADLFICVHCNSACYRDKRKKEICNEES